MKTTATGTSRFDRDLQTAKQLYRSLGYEVEDSSATDSLPEALRKFNPDFVATRNGEHVVVNVKAPQKVRRVDYWQHFKDAVDTYPGYRLDLFVPGEGELEVETRVPTQEAIAELVDLAESQLRLHQNNVSLVTAWIALEAVMRSVATRRNLRLDALYPSSLLAALYEDGEFDGDDYTQLRKSLALRNSVAHGRSFEPAPPDAATAAIAASRELLKAR